MAKKTPIDKLATALEKILDDYQEDTTKNLQELSKKFTKKGAQAVRQAASANGWSDYANGWTSQFETGRLSAQGTIYNKKAGLPHLLENGHALRNGGRAKAYPHIAPVEEKLVEEFQKAVTNDL